MSLQTELGWAGGTAVERDPQRVSGASVFRGTWIPVAALQNRQLCSSGFCAVLHR